MAGACSAVLEDAAGYSVDKEKQPRDYLREAVVQVVKDEGFGLPSEHARAARVCAEKLLEWMSDKPIPASVFASNLVVDLRRCFDHTSRSAKVSRERMWEKFYKLRSDDKFKNMWVKFLEDSIATRASPIFFQYVTEKVMEQLIKKHFTVESGPEIYQVSTLDYLELNALRYAAGYVVRALKKKVAKSAHPLKRDIRLCLEELVEDGGSEDTSGESEDWTELIDRGGLIHVSDTLFSFFTSMEKELRHHIRGANETESIKEKVLKKILESEEVMYYWSLVAVNWEEEEAGALVELIASHWIIVRGFSHASSFIEKYKQKHKKSTQKSKGLRKNLISSNTAHATSHET